MDNSVLASLLSFSAHIALASVMVVVFMIVYARVTPQEELQLIREGNTAAAIALSGAMIGFVIALCRAIGLSTTIWEMALWGLVALAVQCIGHGVLSLMFPRLGEEIERGQTSAAIVSAAVGISLGLINAASMAP